MKNEEWKSPTPSLPSREGDWFPLKQLTIDNYEEGTTDWDCGEDGSSRPHSFPHGTDNHLVYGLRARDALTKQTKKIPGQRTALGFFFAGCRRGDDTFCVTHFV